jgi:hypothetical protein
MIDERVAAEIRDAFENRHSPNPGLEQRVMSAIPWDGRPGRHASAPRIAGILAAVLTLLVLAALLAPSILTMGSRHIRTSPSPSPSSLVNPDPRCKGIQLNPERTYQRIAVYRWRKSGSAYVAVPTGLDGSMVTDARFNPYPNQPNDNTVVFYLNSEGHDLLDKLTSEIAVPQTSGGTSPAPDNYLAWFVGLTDAQVANWSDPAVAQRAVLPLDQGGNLMANALVLQRITGNQVALAFLGELPAACSLTAHRQTGT